MAAPDDKPGEHLTERQKKWFASVRANLEAQTGRSIADWVAIARAGCAGLRPRAQSAWLKENHGVGVNHAAFILAEAFPAAGGWDDAATLRAALWSDPGSLAILEAIETAASGVTGLVQGQRRSFTAWSRDVQFAATRPLKGGRALLALKLDPSASPRLQPAVRKESWSERLSAVVELDGPESVDSEIVRVFAAASENG
jgi:uncharacterized protein DUF4287